MKKDVSVIMPCLNEERTIGNCINKIQNVFNDNNINGEIIVVDNGSNDRSLEIANSFDFDNLKIISEPKKGYGNAYLSGFKHIEGEVIIMGDSDGTYDFNEIPNFLNKIENHDLVMGSRFSGKMEKGAMPFLHKHVGNPVIRSMLRRIHKLNISEPSTGFLAIKKQALDKLDLKQPGMEFSSELLIRARQSNLRMSEIPIDYAVRNGESKLRTFRDGFRHMNFIIGDALH